MKIRAVALFLLVFTGSVTAQTTVETNPGLVKAASPIYGLDKAVDELQVLTGVQTRGAVAYERASEMQVAQRRNHTDAYQRAENGLNAVARRATNNSLSGLQKTEQVLLAVQNKTSSNSSQGVQTALENIRQAQTRTPQPKQSMFGGYARQQRKGVIDDLDKRHGRENRGRRGR